MINGFCYQLILAAAILGCKSRDAASDIKSEPANGSGAVTDMSVVREYQRTIDAYLKQSPVAEGWDWFMYHSHAYSAPPMVLIKMLPEIAPEFFGPPEEKFARFGHFVLPGDEHRVLPSSMGLASFPTNADPKPPILTTETCGTCHMGRVRIRNEDNSSARILTLYGGVNNQFDIRKWRTALEQTVAKYLNSPGNIKLTAVRLRKLVASKPAGFFHENLSDDGRQRSFITTDDGAEDVLAKFITFTASYTAGKNRQRATSYKNDKGNPPDINSGHPGQVDASGDLLSQTLLTNIGMPENASLTDIPSVWKQSEYATGQWDGSVANQFVRNLAAQIAVAPAATVDRRVAHFSLQFATSLPAPKFPFKSDQPENQGALIEKGQKLYATNCADCHAPLNLRRYPQVATDMNRAKVMSTIGGLTIAKGFYDACNARLPDGTSPPSCGDFTQYLRKPDPEVGPGYAGKPLTGIWARAPYLHNGSIPTLRHLLLPQTRPERFVIGSLDYDAVNMGYNWQIDQLEVYRSVDPQVDTLDTRQDGLSHKGHDQGKLSIDGKTYRLDWTPQPGDDPESVDALIAYLKTL